MLRIIRSVARTNFWFNLTCTQLKAFKNISNFKFSTFSSTSKQKLINLAGIRIFDSCSKIEYDEKPEPCNKIYNKETIALSKNFIGDKYLGNWVILIHKKRNKYLTVCGLFNCTDKLKYEKLVKHMNLCVYAKLQKYKDYVYLCSGTFIYSATNGIVVTVLSGTWKDAKNVLYFFDYIPENVDIDSEIIKFAEPHVNKLLVRIFE